MDDKKRLRRDDPVRTEPIRDFSGLYHWSSSDAPSSNSSRPFSTNGSAAVGREHPSDEIRLAYGVIDKHIDEGRKNAGQFSSQPYNARAVTDGFQELLERTLRYGSELLPMWLEILGSAVRMEPSRMPYGAGTAAQHAGGASQSKGSSGVSIEMVSTKPVEVSFDLRENSETLSLVTLGLRRRSGQAGVERYQLRSGTGGGFHQAQDRDSRWASRRYLFGGDRKSSYGGSSRNIERAHRGIITVRPHRAQYDDQHHFQSGLHHVARIRRHDSRCVAQVSPAA